MNVKSFSGESGLLIEMGCSRQTECECSLPVRPVPALEAITATDIGTPGGWTQRGLRHHAHCLPGHCSLRHGLLRGRRRRMAQRGSVVEADELWASISGGARLAGDLRADPGPA